MRAAVACALISLFLITTARAEGPRVFVVTDGAREVSVPAGSIPPARVEVRDPSDGGKRKTLTGPALVEVLAALPAPAGADAVIVRCDDGWMSLVPLSTIQRYRPVLATAEWQGDAFQPLAPPRGPAFLVWPNVATPAVDRDGAAAEAWTWATASFEYVRAKEARAPTEPPAGAPPAARRGAALFQKHCLHCHAVRGFGGMAGWDLARPSILAIRGEPRVRAYIADPRRINPDGHMPAFGARLARRDIDALIDYLQSMSR